MALIDCPECGRQVSDKAVSCPQCGYPISGINDIAAESSESKTSTGKKKKSSSDNGAVKENARSLISAGQSANINGYSMEELYPERFSGSKGDGGKGSSGSKKGSRSSAAEKMQTAPPSQTVTYEKSQAIPRYTGTIYDYKPIATKHHIMSILAFIFIWIPGLCIVGLILAIIDLAKNREYRHGLSYAAIILFAGIYFVLISLYGMKIKAVERENAARNQTTVTDTYDRTKDSGSGKKSVQDDNEKLPYDDYFDEQ